MPKKSRNTHWLRRGIQLAVVVLILYKAIMHQTAGEGTNPSVDVLCPFGAVETAWRLITSGSYIQRIYTSSVILGIGLFVGTLLGGGSFCGWLCPLGTIQDWLASLRKKLKVKEVVIPEAWDRWLRRLRYVVLGLVIYITIKEVRLVFAPYDPYRTIFSLHWVFEPSWEDWLGYSIALLILAASFFIERFWCRFLCPLGAIIGFLQRFSLMKVKRDPDLCTNCRLCDRACAMKIPVSKQVAMGSSCTGCLECVEACPKQGALGVSLPGPVISGKKEEIVHAN